MRLVPKNRYKVEGSTTGAEFIPKKLVTAEKGSKDAARIARRV
jgi:hypothetical protein